MAKNIDSLSIASFNVNGLNSKMKRIAKYNNLKLMKHVIILLKETHSVNNVINTWNKEWGNNQGLHNHGTSASKDVAILFGNKINNDIDILKEYKDDQRRLLIIDIKKNDLIFAIFNIYCQTKI